MERLMEEETGKIAYNLFSENIATENGEAVLYGISVCIGNEIEEIHGITSVYSVARDIFENIIRNVVTPVHLKDVVTDMISI